MAENPVNLLLEALPPILETSEMFALMKRLREARNVVITCHANPDGDALGSVLGWQEYLRSLGKRTQIVLPTPYPDFLRWLPGADHAYIFDTGNDHRQWRASPQKIHDAFAAADLICCLDFNEPSRVGGMEKMLREAKADKILIDHHEHPDTAFFVQLVSRPEASSTCELVCRLICQLGAYEQMSRSAAEALYCGMMTDTGAFSYASSAPHIYLLISLLLAKGIDKDAIYRNVYHAYSADRLKLVGHLLCNKLEFHLDNHASIYSLTAEEMKQFHFKRGDAEGIVNLPLQVKGLRLSIALREDTAQPLVRVSMRSVGDLDCTQIAKRFFNGGGHKNASGGSLPLPMETALQTARDAIEAFKDEILGASV